jgi:hypothetical protein
VFLSAWRFYNSGLALSLAPWVMAALVRLLRAAEHGQGGDRDGARRAAAELGLLAGLEVLAGEPVVVLLTAVIAAARFAASHRAWRRAGVPVALATLIALLVAAPQIAATAQILDSSRARAIPFVVATGTSTHPVRLVEQVVPFPMAVRTFSAASASTPTRPSITTRPISGRSTSAFRSSACSSSSADRCPATRPSTRGSSSLPSCSPSAATFPARRSSTRCSRSVGGSACR